MKSKVLSNCILQDQFDPLLRKRITPGYAAVYTSMTHTSQKGNSTDCASCKHMSKDRSSHPFLAPIASIRKQEDPVIFIRKILSSPYYHLVLVCECPSFKIVSSPSFKTVSFKLQPLFTEETLRHANSAFQQGPAINTTV